jgi:serine/threonine protein phosphatase PrpC
VAGVRHRLSGQPSQDSFAWAADEDRVALAITDGLGGVPGSDATAARAAPAAADAALAAPGSLADRARAGLEAANLAARGGGATTIVVAVLQPDGVGVVARVGDSTAFVLGASGLAGLAGAADPRRRDEGTAGGGSGLSWHEVFGRARSDVVDPITAALPMEAVTAESAAVSLQTDDVLVLATDGVADPWRDGPTTVAPAFARALSQPLTPLELAHLVDFSRQGCHDDRTVLAVWRAASPADSTGTGNR